MDRQSSILRARPARGCSVLNTAAPNPVSRPLADSRVAVAATARRLMRMDTDKERDTMQYTIYEHPLTHLFAFVALPHGYVEGDESDGPIC